MHTLTPLLRTSPALWRWVSLAVLAMPLLIFAAYAARELLTAQDKALHAELNRAALDTANAINLRLESSMGHLTGLATSEAALRNDIPALYAHAQRVMQAIPEATAISLVGAGNELIFLTLKPLGTTGLAVGDPEAVKQVFLTGKPAVSGAFKSPIADRMVTSLGVPIFHEGKVIYCLRLILRTSALNDMLHAQKLPADWTLAIFKNDGSFVARSRNPETYIGKQTTVAVQEVLRTRNHLPLELPTVDGIAHKGIFLSLPGWDWSVGVGAPVAFFHHQRSQMLQWLGLLGLALLALGALVVAAVSPLLGQAPPSTTQTRATLRTGNWLSVFALLVVVGMGVLLTLNIQAGLARLQERSSQALAAAEKKTHLTEFLSLFKDLETAHRGYLLTGEGAFLDSYTAASRALSGSVSRLRESLRDIPLGPFNWREFEETAMERQQLAAGVLAKRRQMGGDMLQTTSLLDQGRWAMDSLRLQVATLDQLVDQRIRLLSDALAEERARMRQTLWLTSLASWILVVFALGLWWRERRQRVQLYAQLEDSHGALEQRVLQRTQELQQAHIRLRQFASESEHRMELERTRISREVHDQLGQIFTGVKMILGTLRPGSLDPGQQKALVDALDMGVQTTRRIAAELRPPLLDDLGLSHAVAHYLQKSLEPLGIAYTLELSDAQDLNAQQTTQLFRVIQECCTNICRHAQARHVDIKSRAQQEEFVLYIDDDGMGFDESQVRDDALGLLGIRERVQMMGGRVEFLQRPSGGTRVAVHLALVRNGNKEVH